MIAQNFRDAGMEPLACDIYTPDILAIARGYGCEAVRAHDLAWFSAALSESSARPVPTVIELRVADFIQS